MNKPARQVLPALLLMTSVLAHGQQRMDTFSGDAHDLRSGELLYSEQHFQLFEGERIKERLVLYRCPGGEVFARKRVDYRENALAPAFAMEDRRASHREGLRRDNGRAEVFIQRGGESRESAASVAAKDNLVADAGFDEFIRQNWDALQGGAAPRIRFLLPFRQDTMSFRVRKQRDEDIDGEPASTFRLSLSGLLGLFASSIEASYHRETRALLRYEGVSNVRDASGENYVTRILFPPERHASLDDASAFEQAADETLVTECRV